MPLGEFDHGAELGTEGLAGREVIDFYGKTALAVNVDGCLLHDRAVGTSGRRSVMGIRHFCTAWVESLSHPYLPELEGQGRRGLSVACLPAYSVCGKERIEIA